MELTGCREPIHDTLHSQAILLRNRIGCPKRASAEITFTARIPLPDGLQRLIDWRKVHNEEVALRRAKAR